MSFEQQGLIKGYEILDNPCVFTRNQNVKKYQISELRKLKLIDHINNSENDGGKITLYLFRTMRKYSDDIDDVVAFDLFHDQLHVWTNFYVYTVRFRHVYLTIDVAPRNPLGGCYRVYPQGKK